MVAVTDHENRASGDPFQQRGLSGALPFRCGNELRISTNGAVLPVTPVTQATDDLTSDTPRCPKCGVPGPPHNDIVKCADALIAYYDISDVTGNEEAN